MKLLHQTVYMGSPGAIPDYIALEGAAKQGRTRTLNLQVTQKMSNTQHRPSRVAAAAKEIAGHFDRK